MGDLIRFLASAALAALPPAATQPVPTAIGAGARALSLTSSESTSDPRHRAVELMRRAEATPYTPPARFAILIAARDAAVGDGDAEGAVTAARALAAGFGRDELTETADVLVATAAHTTAASDFTALARFGMDVVTRRLATARTAADYTATAPLATASATWALAGDDPALQVKAQEWARDVRALVAQAERIAPALERLQTAPDDPAANLAAGRLLCFDQDDWRRGLPHLAKGSDANLATPAALELAHGGEATAWTQLGDGWWEQARSLDTARAKANAQRHACAWYAKAYPRAIGPRRALIERRSAEAGFSLTDPDIPAEPH